MYIADIATALAELTDILCLAEEGVHLPEFLLLPFVERMVVALGALHLEAEEDFGGHRRGLSGVFVELHHEVVRRAIEIGLAGSGAAGGGDQLIGHRVVGLFAGERIPQVLLHALAIDERAALQTAVAAD